MDSDFNPYAAPLPDPEHRRYGSQANHHWSRGIAWLFVGISVACGLIYTYLDEMVIRTGYGIWPQVLFAAILSLVSAVVTRNLWVAPLSCFLGTMAGDLMAGYLVSWTYAQVLPCVAISFGFSLPAFMVAAFLSYRKSSSSGA